MAESLTNAEINAVGKLTSERNVDGHAWAEALMETHFKYWRTDGSEMHDQDDLDHVAAFFNAAIRTNRLAGALAITGASEGIEPQPDARAARIENVAKAVEILTPIGWGSRPVSDILALATYFEGDAS